MSDDIDEAQNLNDLVLNNSLNAARAAAAKMPVGNPGDCTRCGEYFTRLVNGVCARCRDKYGLP